MPSTTAEQYKHGGVASSHGSLSGTESPGSETRRPLICRIYTGSFVYSLVALNHIKYHPECTKTHHFQIKYNRKKFWEGGTRPRIAGETRLLSWTTLSTASSQYGRGLELSVKRTWRPHNKSTAEPLHSWGHSIPKKYPTIFLSCTPNGVSV